MLEIIKNILGIIDNSQDILLNWYIQKATNFFLSQTNLTAVPQNAGTIIIDLVILAWNKRGSEGLQSENMSGISYNWLNGLPQELSQQIACFRRIAW